MTTGSSPRRCSAGRRPASRRSGPRKTTISRSASASSSPLRYAASSWIPSTSVAPCAGEHADQQQPALRGVEPGPAPDVGEEVVGGVAEEVAGPVLEVPAVDLLHLVQAALRARPSVSVMRASPRSWQAEPGGEVAAGPAAPGVRRPRAARPARPRSRGPSRPSARDVVERPRPESSGATGAVVSRCMIAPGPPVIASVCRTTSPSATRSSPAASASRCASVAAVNDDEVQQVAGQLHPACRRRPVRRARPWCPSARTARARRRTPPSRRRP